MVHRKDPMNLVTRAFLALLAVVLLGNATDVKAAHEAPKDGAHSRQEAKNRDFDGNMKADCGHLVNREEVSFPSTEVNYYGQTIRTKTNKVTVQVEMNSSLCKRASAAGRNSLTAFAQSWTCRAKVEKKTLLGLNWGLYLEQGFSTNDWLGDIIWPPRKPIPTVRAQYGWSVDRDPSIYG